MRRLFVAVLVFIMPVAAPGDTHVHITPPVVTDDIVWIGIDRFDVPYAVTSRADLLSRDQKGWVIVHRPDFAPARDATGVSAQAGLREAAIRYVNGLVVRARVLATATNIGRSLGPYRGLTKNGRTVALLANASGGSSGARSYLATSDDGGHSWTRARSNTTAELRAIAVGTDNDVYAAGTRGIILRSTDGGRTWHHVTLEWNSPPPNGWPIPSPWYVLWNLFVTVPLLAVAARSLPRDESMIDTNSVAEMLGSDRPLQKGDPDAMNLRSIALAISRFLRNESTLPPLTVAVTGEWGSGKSSLMNLLRADLIDFGFRPVWFNAWHHQKEEHLLASLLQAVRQQAVPRWWRPENSFFRLRLIWIRGWKHRANLLLLILFLSLAVGFETRHHAGHPFATIDEAVQAISQNDLQHIAVKLPHAAGNEMVALLTLVTVLATAWRGAKAFHVNPATLLATLAGSAKVKDLTAEISFRDKFAAEFSDVTTALGERRLLIFIDDLDRCSPSSVSEVLEAVNFLVSSGDCFVVMGMDRTRVERYINVNFKEVAASEEGFARKYLDKLVNIEVPVPEPSDDASTQILVPLHAVPEPISNWQLLWQAGISSLRFWPVALAFVIAAAGFLSMAMMPQQQPAIQNSESGAGKPAAAPPPAASGAAAGAATVPLNTKQPGDVRSGVAVTQWVTAWPALLFWIALIGVGAWLLMRPHDVVVHDSPLFLNAIRIWRPVIVKKLRTPRALKRFMNRLRYLAMRQRPQEETLTFWRQIRLWIMRKKPERPPLVTNAIPEPALVALAAMELYDPRDIPEIKDKETQHHKEFGHSPSDWEAAFRNTAAGVHAN